MTKQYVKGYNYSVSCASLIRPTLLVLENNGKYGVNKLEAQIRFNKGCFGYEITDGYSILKLKVGFHSLKQAMNHAHAAMVTISKDEELRKQWYEETTNNY